MKRKLYARQLSSTQFMIDSLTFQMTNQIINSICTKGKMLIWMDRPQIVDNIIAGLETSLGLQTYSYALFYPLLHTWFDDTPRKIVSLTKTALVRFWSFATRIDRFATIRSEFKSRLSTENRFDRFAVEKTAWKTLCEWERETFFYEKNFCIWFAV